MMEGCELRNMPLGTVVPPGTLLSMLSTGQFPSAQLRGLLSSHQHFQSFTGSCMNVSGSWATLCLLHWNRQAAAADPSGLGDGPEVPAGGSGTVGLSRAEGRVSGDAAAGGPGVLPRGSRRQAARSAGEFRSSSPGAAAQTMLLVRLASPLFRAVPRAGCRRLWPGSGVLGGRACGRLYGTRPAGPGRAASLPRTGAPLELEEMLVPRKMSVSPLESWLTARCLLPRPGTGTPGTAAPPQSHECPPCRTGEGAGQGEERAGDALPVQCKNVLKIRRRKMNHHKYRKLVKRTRFLRRKIREGRLKRKQLKFERDLRRIWLQAGLKEAPEGWQTPKIYQRGR
nr:aurora kinase A-interacting protein [Aotus nancymaae]